MLREPEAARQRAEAQRSVKPGCMALTCNGICIPEVLQSALCFAHADYVIHALACRLMSLIIVVAATKLAI